VKQYQNDQFNEALAEYFAVSSTSLRSVESPEFLRVLNAYKLSSVPTPLPSRKRLGKLQQSLANKRFEDVLMKAARAELPASLALDGWNNCAQSKVTNVLLLSQGNAYFLKSYENKYDSTNSEWLLNTLQPLFQLLDEKGVEIAGLVMDNASINLKLYELLKEKIPHLIHLPCSAHILQLCVNGILNMNGVREVVEFMDTILNIFPIKFSFYDDIKTRSAGFYCFNGQLSGYKQR
jgi:hypothetical protein